MSEEDTETFFEDLAALLESAESAPGSSTGSNSLALTGSGNANMPGTSLAVSSAEKDLLKTLLPDEVVGTMVEEALNGFTFLTDAEGNCVMISELADRYLGAGYHKTNEGESMYNMLHMNDHARFSAALLQAREGQVQGRKQAYLNSSVFTARFFRNVGSDEYETLQVSVVSIKPDSRTFGPGEKDLSKSRLYCVARQVAAGERLQYHPVDLFSTKLDLNFRIVVVDTTGLNVVLSNSIMKVMLGRSFLDLVHERDRDRISAYLDVLMSSSPNSVVTEVYRLRIFDRATDYVHVKTKSKYFRAAPHAGNVEAFFMCTHFVIGDTELRPDDLPPPLDTPHQKAINNNNNLKTSTAVTSQSKSPSSSSTSSSSSAAFASQDKSNLDSQKKNLLLKQLLNVNFSRSEGGTPSGGGDEDDDKQRSNVKEMEGKSSTSRILQLLSQSKDNVPRDGSPLSPRKRRPSSTVDGEPSPKLPSTSTSTSTVCKQNPSLTTLLSKPPQTSVTVPPPVPTKWHQEPRESLPKEVDRGASNQEDSRKLMEKVPVSTTLEPRLSVQQQVAHSLACPPSSNHLVISTSSNVSLPLPSLTLDDATVSDDMLSEILDDVIDFQEKSPTGVVTTSAPFNSKSNIEKFLTSEENEMPFMSSGGMMSGGAMIQTVAGLSSAQTGAPVASNVKNNNGNNPANLVPRMNELLQVVPPNVTMSMADCPDLDSLLQLDLERNRRRSGSSIPTHPSPKQSMQHRPQSAASSTTITTSSSTNLLMQQLSSAPLSQPSHSHSAYSSYNSPYNNSLSVRQQSNPMMRLGGSQSRLPVRSQYVIQQRSMMPASPGQPLAIQGTYTPHQQHLSQQQHQHQQQVPSSLRAALQQPQQRTFGQGDEQRSLLQQLLSDS